MSATLLHKELAVLATELNATRPEGLRLPSTADIKTERAGAISTSNSEYAESLSFISRANPKLVWLCFQSGTDSEPSLGNTKKQ